MTISQALSWVKTLRERHQELVQLRNQNSSQRTHLFGDKEVKVEVLYDAKKLDKRIGLIARDIRKCEDAIKQTNATVQVVGYEKDENILGELE